FVGFPKAESERLAGQPARWEAVEGCLDEDFRVGDAYRVPAASSAALRDAFGLPAGDEAGDLVLVPLRSSGGEPMGALVVDQPIGGQTPTGNTLELLQIFANQAAVVIENSQLYSSMEARAEELSASLENLEHSYQELDRLSHEMIRKDVELSQANELLNLRAQRLLALHRVMESVDTTQDTEMVMQEIASAVVREMDVDHCLLILGGGSYLAPLHIAASAGSVPERAELEALLDGDDPISRAFKNREAVVYQLDDGDSSAAKLARALGAYALIAISFQLEPSVTGVLLVGSTREGVPFSGEDRDLLNLLASQITVEYENARLYQAVQSEAASAAGERDRLQQLHMTTTTLQQTENVEERLNVIARGLHAVGWNRVAISLVDENLDSIKLITEGYLPKQRSELIESLVPGQEWQARLDDELFRSTRMGMCYFLAHDHPWVQEHLEPVEAGVDYGPDDWHPGDQLYLPMYAGGEIIGWTILRDPISGKRPDPASMRPIELFVRQASSALENARLYQETLDLKSYNEAVVQSIQQGIVVTDAKGYVESFNAFIRDQYAWPEEAVGQNLFKVEPKLAVIEGDLAMVARDKQPAERSGVQYLVADEVHTLNIYMYPRYDETRWVTGVVILIEDVTQRTRLEADMALRGQQLAALSEVSRQITATLSVDHVVGNALDQAREVIRYDRVVLWLRDMEKDTLAMIGVRGYVDDTATLEPVVRVGDYPRLAEIVREKLPVLVEDLRDKAGSIEDSFVTMRTWLGLPLISGGDVIGVIVFERIDPHAYAPADTQVATAFTNQVAVALENARLFEEAKEQAQELHSRTNRLAQLNSISNTFGRSLDQQSIMQTAVDVMAQTLEMTQGSVIVFDHAGDVGELTIQHPSNPDGSVETIRLKIDGNPAFEHLCGSKTPLVVDDVSSDPVMAGMQPFLKARNVKSVLMTPLVVGNEVIGTIALEETNAPRTFEAEHVELAQTITNQAAVAVQNARLFQETVTRRAELSILFEAGRIASSSLDLYNVVHNAARYYVRAMDVSSATISMWDPEADSLVTLVEFSRSNGTRPLNELVTRSELARYPVVSEVIDGQEPTVLAAALPGLSEAETAWLDRLDAASLLVIPLVTRDETIGLVELAVSEAGRDFDEREMRLARALSASVATAMENARLHDETQKRLTELSEINQISRQLAQTISAEDLFRLLHEQINRVIDADSITVAQHELKKNRLVFPCVIRGGLRVPVEPVAYGGDLYSHVIDNREPLLIARDMDQALKKLKLTHAEPDLKSFMGVPLISGEKVVGVLAVEDYEQEGSFNEADLRVLGPIAAQVSVSIENARLYGELEQRLSETTTLQEVSRVVNSALDLQEIFERVVSELASAFKYPLLGLYTLEGRELVLQAHHGYDDDVVEKLRRISVDGEILGRSIIQKEPIFVENVRKDPDYVPVLDWVTSMVVVPVLSDEFILGVLAVQSGADKPLTENDLQLLRTFAGQVSTAMVNASLYAQMVELSEELERRVEERTRELREERDRIDTLFRITVELTASLDLDRVLNRALELVADAVGAEHGSLYLVDPQSEMLIHRAVMSSQQLLPPGGRQIPLSRHEGMAGWVMDNRESIVVDNVQVDPRWVNVPGTEHNRSLLGAPLIANEEVLGCIFFTSDRLNAFHEGHVRLVEAAANQVATSINNAELYRLIRDQAERLGTMLRSQQTEAAKSQAILESIADGVMVSDQTGEVILFNAASERILGLRRDQVLGRPTTEMVGIYGAGAERWTEMLIEWGKDPGTSRGAFLSEQIEVGEKIVSVHVSPVAHGDELLGLVSVFRDITREVMADRIKTEFVSNVSHELRTPMTSIKGYADLLLLGAAGEITDEQRRFLEIVKTNADRLSLLVNDLLDISRIEQGRVQLDLLDVDLHELIGGVIDVIEGRKENDGRSIELAVDIPEDLPNIQADYDRITQVITNLVSNAYQYTPDDGKVTVKATPQEEGVLIDVIDTGIGISEEDQERIFERFFRGEDPMVMRAAGTGLGLSIVQHLVEMHHGKVTLASKLHEGTTFSVWLPYVVESAEDRRQPKWEA
ncbi:MAG: GAF domain-containing protein, partial [Chloroflexota bacterium]